MATQRLSTPTERSAARPLGLLMTTIGLGMLVLGLIVISEFSVLTQPAYVYLLPVLISVAGSFYMARGLFYTLRR